MTPTPAGIVVILALCYALDISIAGGFAGVENGQAGRQTTRDCGTFCGITDITRTQNHHCQDNRWERIILYSHFQLLIVEKWIEGTGDGQMLLQCPLNVNQLLA